MSSAADDLWEELDDESDKAEPDDPNKPDRDEPWAEDIKRGRRQDER